MYFCGRMIVGVLFCLLARVHADELVTTAEGNITGLYFEALLDGGFYKFLGIPYAEVGSDKFGLSTPVCKLRAEGSFKAHETIECARPGPNGIVGNTDCLVLNVFTKDLKTSNPVLVWLNDEESNSASSQYSYTKLLNQNVVLVTLNYRLSVFGFLCLRTERHPGNAGLKDIILGLKWIQRNIGSFGGNSSNVILMGHGSAAALVDLITLVPHSKNLVHKAIALSGSGLSPWAISYHPIEAADVLINSIAGLQSVDDVGIFLSNSSLLPDINEVLYRNAYTNNTEMFAPCIENADLNEALLTETPINLLRAGNSDIPYLAGYVTREGTQKLEQAISEGWLEKMQNNFTDFLSVDLNFDDTKSKAEDIRKFYFHNDAINMSTIDSYFLYHGDTMVVVPVIRSVRMRAEKSLSKVWLFEFGYKNYDPYWDGEIPLNGVTHGSILNYIFNIRWYFDIYVVADSIQKQISDFAHTGIPSLDVNSAEWKPFTRQSPSYLSYAGNDENMIKETKTNPQEAIMSFWEPLYNTSYHAPAVPSSTRKNPGSLTDQISNDKNPCGLTDPISNGNNPGSWNGQDKIFSSTVRPHSKSSAVPLTALMSTILPSLIILLITKA